MTMTPKRIENNPCKMKHTPEPWIVEKDRESISTSGPCRYMADYCQEAIDKKTIRSNAARIVACVNGCQGLNPAAYRQVVEALTAIVARINGEFDNPALEKYGMLELDSLEGIKRIAQQALTAQEIRASQQQPYREIASYFRIKAKELRLINDRERAIEKLFNLLKAILQKLGNIDHIHHITLVVRRNGRDEHYEFDRVKQVWQLLQLIKAIQ